MPRKLNLSPPVLMERAVLCAVANSRQEGWRQTQMKVFASRLGDYPNADKTLDLERECTRIVRASGHRYARKLLNWFVTVQKDVLHQPEPLNFPIGIPRQSQMYSVLNRSRA